MMHNRMNGMSWPPMKWATVTGGPAAPTHVQLERRLALFAPDPTLAEDGR